MLLLHDNLPLEGTSDEPVTIQRLLFSIVLAIACTAVLATSVYVDFDRVRLRVVNGPLPERGMSLSIPLPDLTPVAGAPAAVIIRVQGDVEPSQVAISLDGARLADITVGAGEEVRVDTSARLPPGPGHALTLQSDRAGWEVTYLELANIHGFSSGTVEFVIVPDGAGPAGPPPWVWLPFFFGVTLLLPRPEWPRGGGRRALYWLAAGLVCLFFAAALLSERFTPYRLLLSLHTFLLCTAVLYSEPLARAARWADPHVRRALGISRVGLHRWGYAIPYLLVPIMFLWSVTQFYREDTGFTSLIAFGDAFSGTAHPDLRSTPHAVDKGSGYDGQFYAQLALDPLLRTEDITRALDAPGYRGRRILFPWIAHLLGLSKPWYVLQAYALLNVASWLGLAWLLLRWLPPGALRPAFAWCGCMLAEGLLDSVHRSLVDGPSMLLLAVGVALVEKNRRGAAAGLLGVAGLGRDTNLLAGVVLPKGRPTLRSLATLSLQGLVIAAPLMLWVLYLMRRGISPADAGYANFALPFTGYLEKLAVTLGELRTQGWDSFARFSLVSLVSLATQAVVLVVRRDLQDPWWRLGITYAVLMTLLGFSVWEGHPGAAARVVLPMTFAFNILLPGVRWFWPLWVLGNASIISGLFALQVPGVWEYL